ncbi:MAG: helix-turn-helix transcriptional regulator [Treponemataceae bacterium]|nr:helix-turn-helix transcriptional regulator [Spirochaetales bacterium]MDY6031604.1 helix-turn-helix transcriptional regulator [Treponemataceae bacterium]
MTPKELRENLSKNIKHRRAAFSLTQEKLAEKVEFSAQMINDIEGCRTWVSDKTLVKLAETLHTTPAELLLKGDTDSAEKFDILHFKSDLQTSVQNTIDKLFESII